MATPTPARQRLQRQMLHQPAHPKPSAHILIHLAAVIVLRPNGLADAGATSPKYQGFHDIAANRSVSILELGAATPVEGLPSFLWGSSSASAAENGSAAIEAASGQQSALHSPLVQQLMLRKPLHAWWVKEPVGTE